MYANYLKVADVLNNNVGFQDRTNVMALSVGWHIAQELAVPPAPVANPTIYFYESFGKEVSDKVGMMNETIVLNTKYAMESTFQFWMNRYLAVHPLSRAQQLNDFNNTDDNQKCFFASAMGANQCFSQATISDIQKHAGAILRISYAIAEVEKEEK